MQMGLKTCYINLYICRKIRFFLLDTTVPASLPSGARSEAKESQVCLWIHRTFMVCLCRQPAGKIALCLTKPEVPRTLKSGGLGARVLTFPISNWVILDEVLQLSSFNFLIFKMEMIRPDSQGFTWIRRETIWEGTGHTPEY